MTHGREMTKCKDTIEFKEMTNCKDTIELKEMTKCCQMTMLLK